MHTKKYMILLVIVLLISLAAIFNNQHESSAVTIDVNGQIIKTVATNPGSPDELMIPKAAAEQALNMHIGWQKQGALPKGIYYRDHVAVLMYHHLSEKPMPQFPWILSADRFDDQMNLLKQEGFHVITMEQYREFMLNGGTVPDNAVLLTFDDGYESFYELAFPILKKYGYTAVNFVIVSTIDHPDPNSVPKLNWEQMREMKRDGMGFYSHTYDLHHYGIVDAEGGERPAASALLYIDDENRNEMNTEYYSRVTRDLAKAEQRLKEELGNTDSAIAFPYGSYNDRLLSACDSLGISLTFKIQDGINARTDRNASRINGGSQSLTAVQTLEQVKHIDSPMELTLNNQRVALIGSAPEMRKGTLMVPFIQLCKDLHIDLNYDQKSRIVKLMNTTGGS
ncbi:polysaccharide deacetylase family protein [Paenibacillus sp. FSL R5-0914]|uniref:polysaccharide deacetylase family protein n=1 Tax=Paenibacillus sp. FSL R5-0914 TaxID=2921665 RepID=UPI0030F92581